MRTAPLSIASLVLLVLCVVLSGCAADGYAPGPATNQVSTVPTPIGAAVLSGERDFKLVARNVNGKHTSNVPSVEYLEITREASPPIATRGSSQLSIEQMRYEQSIANFERAANTLNSIAMQWAPFAQQYFPPGGFQSAPNRQDAIKDELLELILAEIAKRKPTTQPAP